MKTFIPTTPQILRKKYYSEVFRIFKIYIYIARKLCQDRARWRTHPTGQKRELCACISNTT